jgi:5'-3' exonuclease
MKIMDTKESKDRDSFSNTLIVDGLNLAFRYKHNKTKKFASEYMSLIQSLANSYKANKVIILGDGGSSYRKGIYPEYKANRKELIEKQTEQEREEFEEFLKDFDDTLKLLETCYTTIKFIGVEADDIAAYITKHYAEALEHVWLVSSDKDWDLLVDYNVSRFSYRTRRETTLDTWNQHYTYKPEQHISIKVLTGDSGDNIHGVPQIGIKRAETLLNNYGNAFDVYDNLPIDSHYKYIKNLNEFGDKLLLNYELMDLLSYCDEALGEDNCKEVDKLIGSILDDQ